MARIYIYECNCGGITLSKEEFVKPDSYKQISAVRFSVNLDDNVTETDGYPIKSKPCESCGTFVTSKIYDVDKIPEVYFNYMGDD